MTIHTQYRRPCAVARDWNVANSHSHARHVPGKITFALIVPGMASVNVSIEMH